MEYKKFYTIAEIDNLIKLSHKMENQLNDELTINICNWVGTTPEQRLQEVQDEIKYIFTHIGGEAQAKVIEYELNKFKCSDGRYDELVDGREKIYINE